MSDNPPADTGDRITAAAPPWKGAVNAYCTDCEALCSRVDGQCDICGGDNTRELTVAEHQRFGQRSAAPQVEQEKEEDLKPFKGPKAATLVDGYRCSTCNRAFFIERPEEAYACPICKGESIWLMVGPFSVSPADGRESIAGEQATHPAPESREQGAAFV